MNSNHIDVFESARPGLLGLAYRILGSLSDAEDAVQDTWLRWQAADRDRIAKPPAWLTTTCTRRCLDLLRAAHRSRTEYVGAWLPEPIESAASDEVETSAAIAASLSTAFLMLLERLTPKERAAFLLHEIFDRPYAETAEAVGVEETACRKLVSRARANIAQSRIRSTTPPDRQQTLLAAFRDAVETGRSEPLAALLCDDVRVSADGGGKVPALRDVLSGRSRVVRFVACKLSIYWAGFEWSPRNLNGASGFVLTEAGETVAAVSFGYDESGDATDIFIVRNPDKLARLQPVSLH